MKTLLPFLVATTIATFIAVIFAAIPVLFQPAFGLWVVMMLLILTWFEYRSHSDLGHH